MKRTSRASRLVRIAARSPARASTGPEVILKFTPSSRAIDLRQRGLTKAGRAVKQRVIHGLTAHRGAFDEDAQVGVASA